ncbi:hypothetical protein L7F22_064708 [Adiantum nelumboides]|nr:hypothetical protein [Adiantum nelumboides]
MGRSKRIEWQYVEKIKALRKGQWTCKCNFCGHVWGGGPHRIRSHLLSLPGQGVGPCDSVTEDVKDIVRRLHADASSDGKDSREAIDALVDDLGGSASQSQGDASLSTHGEGSTHASGSSKSNVNSSKKRKVAQGAGGLPAAFGLQARKQADQALRRFFYAEDVPEWKVRSPYFLDMIKAIGNVGRSYVPPSYHALRTTELNDEVQCLKKEIMGVRSSNQLTWVQQLRDPQLQQLRDIQLREAFISHKCSFKSITVLSKVSGLKGTLKEHFGEHQIEGLDLDIEAGVIDDDSVDKHGGLLEFYPKVHAIQLDLDQIQDLLRQLQEENEVSKTLSQPASVKELKGKMEADVDEVIKITRTVKEKLEKLDKENVVNRKKFGCEEGTSVDRSRVSLTLSLKRKLQNLLKEFQDYENSKAQTPLEGSHITLPF